MWSTLTLVVIAGQLVAAVYAYISGNIDLWNLTVGDGSLIYLIRHSLGSGDAFSSHPYAVAISLFNAVKYVLLMGARTNEERPVSFILALVCEAIYLITCGYYS